MKKINSVSGEIYADKLGVTLMHEHLFNNYPYYLEKQNSEFALNQLKKLQAYGVQTLVDLTPYAKVGTYENVIEESDINIICAVGVYLGKLIPSEYKRLSVDGLVKKMAKKIEVGSGKKHYKPGVIKIAASGAALSEYEKRFFKAAAIIQQQFHLPIATHSPHGALNHLEYLLEVGAEPKHIYISHIENEINKSNFEKIFDNVKKILSYQTSVVLTNFGSSITGSRCKNSIQLAQYIKEQGKLSQLLLSADSNWRWKGGSLKLRENHLGGSQRVYTYVFTHIIPELKKNGGFEDSDFEHILKINPQTMFDYR